MEKPQQTSSSRAKRYMKWGAASLAAAFACVALSFLLTVFEVFECCFSTVPHPVSNLTLILFNILFLAGIVGLLLLFGLFLGSVVLQSRRQTSAGWGLLASVLSLLMFGLAILSSSNGMRAIPLHNEQAQAFYESMAQQRAAATAQAPFARMTSAHYSPDGKRILTVSDNGTGLVWDAQTGQQLLVLGGGGPQPPIFGRDCSIYGAVFSDDGKKILSADCTWDAETGSKIKSLVGKVQWVGETSRPSRDGRWIVTAQGRWAYFWDAATGKEKTHELEISKNGLSQIKFSPDSKRLLAASPYDVVRIWDVATGNQLIAVGPSGSQCATFTLDGKQIATGGLDKLVRVSDAATGQELRVMNEKQAEYVSDLAPSPDGKRIVSIGKTSIYVWDVETGKQVLTWDTGINAWSVEYSADGSRIVTANDGGMALVWDATTGHQVLALRMN